MKQRSQVFTFFSLALLTSGLSVPLQAVANMGINSESLLSLVLKVSVFHWLTLSLSLVAALLAWNASKFFVHFAGLSILSATILNLVSLHQIKAPPISLAICVAGTLGILLLGFNKNVRAVIKDPRQRWWLTSPRRAVQLRTVVNTWSNEKIFGCSENLSRNGIFIELNARQMEEMNAIRKMEIGKLIHLKLDMGNFYILHIQAKVVRKKLPT